MISVAGFPSVLDPLPDERLIYGPHLYPGTIAEGGAYTFPRSLLESHLLRRIDESIKLGLPLLIGETGLKSSGYGAAGYAADSTDLLEKEMAHYTWWAFGYDDDSMGLCDAAGEPKPEFYPHLARPYPQATAGILHSFHFDLETRTLTVSFGTEKDVAPAVEIFVNQRYYYPDGFAVHSTDSEGTWTSSLDEAHSILTITADHSIRNHTVTVIPHE